MDIYRAKFSQTFENGLNVNSVFLAHQYNGLVQEVNVIHMVKRPHGLLDKVNWSAGKTNLMWSPFEKNLW